MPKKKITAMEKKLADTGVYRLENKSIIRQLDIPPSQPDVLQK